MCGGDGDAAGAVGGPRQVLLTVSAADHLSFPLLDGMILPGSRGTHRNPIGIRSAQSVGYGRKGVMTNVNLI